MLSQDDIFLVNKSDSNPFEIAPPTEAEKYFRELASHPPTAFDIDVAAGDYFKELARGEKAPDEDSIARRVMRIAIEQHETSRFIQGLCRRIDAIENEKYFIGNGHAAKTQVEDLSLMEGGIKHLCKDMQHQQIKLTETLMATNGTGYEYYESALQKLENDLRHAIEAMAEDIKRLRTEFVATPTGKDLPSTTDPPKLAFDGNDMIDRSDRHIQPKEHTFAQNAVEGTEWWRSRDYNLKTSIWDIFLFVGMHTPITDLSLCIGVFLMNLILQWLFADIVLLAISKAEMLDVETVQAYVAWRMVAGHNAAYYDSISGTSLVTRVCSNSPTTVLSANELSLHEEYTVYLNRGTGQMMCLLVLLVWLLTVCKEVLSIWEYVKMLCFAHMSDNRNTEICFEEDLLTIRSIGSIRRCALSLLVVFPRLYIAFKLGYGGMLYLIYTKAIEELLLNALALGFVLDLDDIFFELLLPDEIQELVERANPIKFKPSWMTTGGGAFKHVFAVLIVFSILIMANFQYVEIEIDRMRDILHNLCDGNQNFVYSLDKATGAVYAAATNEQFMSYAALKETLVFKAVLQRTELKESLQRGVAGTWSAMIVTSFNQTTFIPHTFRVSIAGNDVTVNILEGAWKLAGPLKTFKGTASPETTTHVNGETFTRQEVIVNSPGAIGLLGQQVEFALQSDELFVFSSSWTRHGVRFKESAITLVVEKTFQTHEQSLNSHKCEDVSAKYYLSVMMQDALGNRSMKDCRHLIPRCNETRVQIFCPATCHCQLGALGIIEHGPPVWFPSYFRKGCGHRCSMALSWNVKHMLALARNQTKTCADNFTGLVLHWYGTASRTISYNAFFDGLHAFLIERYILWMHAGELSWGYTIDGLRLSAYVEGESNGMYTLGPVSDVTTWVQRAIELEMTDCSVIHLVHGIFQVDLCKLSPKYATVQVVCPSTCKVCDADPEIGGLDYIAWDDYYNISETLGISVLRRIET